MEIEGIVDRISNKDGRFGISLVGDMIKDKQRWFNGFGEIKATKGDKVLITYDENTSGDRTFYNTKLEHVVKIGESFTKQADEKSGKEFFPPASEYDKQKENINIRLEATKCASWIVAGLFKTGQAYTFEATVDLIKRYADAIENRIILGIEGE